MKIFFCFVVICFIYVVNVQGQTPIDSLKKAAEFLDSQQLATGESKGGFPWLIQDPTSTQIPRNIQGPIGEAYLIVYVLTEDVTYLNTAITIGDFMLNGLPGVKGGTFSDGSYRGGSHDPLFLYFLSLLTEESKYENFVKEQFWDRMKAGTYFPDFGPFNTGGFIDYLINQYRPNDEGIVAYDLGYLATAAFLMGEEDLANQLMDGVLAGMNMTIATDEWDVWGLAVAVMAAHVTDFDLNPTTGIYSIHSSTEELTIHLANLQMDNGAWPYSQGVVRNESNSDSSVTAFAVRALNLVDFVTYANNIEQGAIWLQNIQITTGDYEGVIPLFSGAPLPETGPVRRKGGVLTHAEAMVGLNPILPEDLPGESSDSEPSSGEKKIPFSFF